MDGRVQLYATRDAAVRILHDSHRIPTHKRVVSLCRNKYTLFPTKCVFPLLISYVRREKNLFSNKCVFLISFRVSTIKTKYISQVWKQNYFRLTRILFKWKEMIWLEEISFSMDIRTFSPRKKREIFNFEVNIFF